MAKLDVKAFAIAGGLLWGASLCILTWLEIAGYGSANAEAFVKSYYIGYEVSPIGSAIGLVYGFFDAGIACGIFAFLYNLIAKK